jgi:hypothetical protein
MLVLIVAAKLIHLFSIKVLSQVQVALHISIVIIDNTFLIYEFIIKRSFFHFYMWSVHFTIPVVNII